MAETRRIPAAELTKYFDNFSRRFLMKGAPGAADIEVMGNEIGDQRVASGARLRGVDYDPHTNALEIALDSGDHDGFVSGLEIVRDDGTKEVVMIRRVGTDERDAR
jgi:hypothetical protein